MREHERIVFRSIFRIKVRLRGSRSLLGYVGDISFGGLRLICDEPIEPGRRFEIDVSMRDGEGQVHQASAEVICQWTRENPRTGHQESGVALEKISASFHALVKRIRAQRKLPAEESSSEPSA